MEAEGGEAMTDDQARDNSMTTVRDSTFGMIAVFIIIGATIGSWLAVIGLALYEWIKR